MQLVLQEATDACRQKHAPSDIYCPEEHRALIRFPVLLVGTLIVTGVLAFMLAGFVGYYNCTLPYVVNGQPVVVAGKPQCWHDIWYPFLYLKEPWPLFLWLSALMVLLQVSILRHYLRRLIVTLIVTLLSIVVVAVVYLLGPDAVVRYLLDPPNGLLYQPLTYAVINFGIILAFLIDSARRWIGYGQTELNPAVSRELMSSDPNRSLVLLRAKIGELVSGDLIAGMILCGVLSIIFTEPFLRGLFSLAAGNVFACGSEAVTTLFRCPIPGYHNPLYVRGPIPVLSGHFISAIDSFLALLCLVPGLFVLAITAFTRGLDPLAGTTGQAAQLQTVGADGRAQDVGVQVGMAVLDTLREALERYILPYARRAILSLRNILWPALILIASFSFALCSRYIQYYLHHWDPNYYCESSYIDLVRKQPGQANFVCVPTDIHRYLELAIAFGLTALICTVLSAALLLISGRVVSNSLRFLGRVGFVALLTFWMFSFALFGFNWFLLDTGIVPPSLIVPAPQSNAICAGASWQLMLTPPHPECSQPFSLSWMTYISFAALIVSIMVLALRMRTSFFPLAGASAARASAARAPAPGATR